MPKPPAAAEPNSGAPATTIPSSNAQTPAPSTGKAGAPKFCPSCGAPTLSHGGGKRSYCQACEHSFDEAGQGRPADFAEKLDLLTNEVKALRAGGVRDPRVDKIDALVQSVSAGMGSPTKLDDLDPENKEQMGKVSMGLAMLKSSPLGAMLGGFFKKREAAPAQPPAQGPTS
jgi:hypothetical protein